MIINKSYMEIMRRGKNQMHYYDTTKHNDLGLLVAVCIILGIMLFGFAWASHADCSGASPEIQKAYQQLKAEGFNVSCRKI